MTDEPITLDMLGAEGEVEWWFWEGDESRLTVDDGARRIWDEAVKERVRTRRALYALGYDFIESGPGAYQRGKVLPSITEVWIGEAGSITVRWNDDPTDPLQ
jgi:hypothetical protein